MQKSCSSLQCSNALSLNNRHTHFYTRAPTRCGQHAPVVRAADGPSGPSSGAPAPAAGGAKSKEDILARISKAKQYKGGSTTTTTTTTTDATPSPLPPGTLPSKQKVDWGAMTAFLDSQGKDSGADAGLPNPYGPASGTADPSGPASGEEAEYIKQAEEARKKRFMAASNKDSDTPEAPMTDVNEYTAMIMSARRTSGAGNATRAASYLQGVLQEKGEDGECSCMEGPGLHAWNGVGLHAWRDLGCMHGELLHARACCQGLCPACPVSCRWNDMRAQMLDACKCTGVHGDTLHMPIDAQFDC